MKGALIHGVLLVVMLVYGYRTWTRDTSTKPNLGAVVLWDKTDADLVAVEYKSDKKIVRLERRGAGGADGGGVSAARFLGTRSGGGGHEIDGDILPAGKLSGTLSGRRHGRTCHSGGALRLRAACASGAGAGEY
jgi:hypothetical protein